METIDEAARRYRGTVERLYAGTWRPGLIVCVTGERLAFVRRDLLGHSDPDAWTPEVGECVLFDRLLLRRGPFAVKVRPFL